MPLDLSAYLLEIGDTRDLVEKINNALTATQDGVNQGAEDVGDRLDEQDAIIDGLAGAITAGVTFKGTHSAAGGSYPAGPANADYWIISTAGTISSIYYGVGDAIVYYSSAWIRIPATPDMTRINPLAKAIRVALAGSASVAGPMVLDDADLDMGTNDFTPVVQKRITTTRPAAVERLGGKVDTTSGVGWTVDLLTTGVLRFTINGSVYDSTAALPSATNVEPVIHIPTVRESTTAAGSVTFVVDGVQLGDAKVIPTVGNTTTEYITNGTFDSDISGWTDSDPQGATTMSWDAGTARLVRAASPTNTAEFFSPAMSLTANKTYRVTANIQRVSGTVSGAVSLRTTNNVSTAANVSTVQIMNSGSDTTIDFLASPTSTGNIYLGFRTYTTACEIKIDNVSVKEVFASVDNAANLYMLGTSSTTTEGAYLDSGIYNRALTVAECLEFCVRGPAFIDIGGSQSAPIYQSDFSAGVDSWGVATMTITGNNDGVGGVDNCAFAACTTTGTATNVRIARGTVIPTVGKYAEITISIYRPASNTTVVGFELADNAGSAIMATTTKAITTAADTWQTFTFKGKITTTSGSQSLRLYPINAAGTRAQQSGEGLYFVAMVSKKVGLCGHWPAAEAQSNTGQVLDRSGNKSHMLLPASGATVLGKSDSTMREVRWTNTWAGTHELQYIGGTNQAMLPSNAKIESITCVITGATVEDFQIGDGSDADRYVAITAGITTGTKVMTLTATPFTDGTNLKLTIDPDANATMTVATTVRYSLLET